MNITRAAIIRQLNQRGIHDAGFKYETTQRLYCHGTGYTKKVTKKAPLINSYGDIEFRIDGLTVWVLCRSVGARPTHARVFATKNIEGSRRISSAVAMARQCVKEWGIPVYAEAAERSFFGVVGPDGKLTSAR